MNWQAVRNVCVGAVLTLFWLVVSALAGWGLAHLIDDLPLMIQLWRSFK